MNTEIAISVKNVSKTFRIPHEKVSSLRGAFTQSFSLFHLPLSKGRQGGVVSHSTYEEFKALDDVSFEVKKGEFFGIIGRNGSGKSTLLKVLAGIYQSDKGNVHINGLISPFLELGIGFNPELSGRDNVYLNATVLGLTKKEIDEKFDAIVAFSELERFIDQKLKNYSSGMQVRLAFSVSIHANRDILLMDEVLAVGDSNFQSKCLEEFAKYRELGRTVILVTHDIAVVQRYCDRALLLRNGQVMKIGKAEEVGNEYVYENMSDEEKRIRQAEIEEIAHHQNQAKSAQKKSEEEQKKPEKMVEVTKVEFLDGKGDLKEVFEMGDDITIRMHYLARQKIIKPVFGMAIHTQDNIHLTGPNTKTSRFFLEKIVGESWLDCIIKKNPFFTGTYKLTVAIFNWECIIPFDYQDKAYQFKVVSQAENQNGVMQLETLWKQ